MFKKGTFIIYGTAGVCQVIDIGRVSGVPVSHPEKDYYTLTSCAPAAPSTFPWTPRNLCGR